MYGQNSDVVLACNFLNLIIPGLIWLCCGKKAPPHKTCSYCSQPKLNIYRCAAIAGSLMVCFPFSMRPA